MKNMVVAAILVVFVLSFCMFSPEGLALQTMSNLMETDSSMPQAAQDLIDASSTSMKQASILVFFGRFAAPEAIQGNTDVDQLKSSFEENYTQNMPDAKKQEYGALINEVLSNINISVKTDGTQGVVTIALADNSNASLVFTYSNDTQNVSQRFAVLDTEPTIIPVTTAEAIALAEGASVLESLEVSPLIVTSALLKTSMDSPQAVATASTVLTQAVFELVGTTDLTVVQVQANLQTVVSENMDLPVDKAEQIVNALTLFVQGAQQAKAGASSIDLISLSSNKVAVIENLAQAVVAELKLAPAQVNSVKQGISKISTNPTQKSTVVNALAKELKVDVAILSTSIETNIITAVVQEGTAVENITNTVTDMLGLSSDKSVEVKQAVAKMITAKPESKAQIALEIAPQIGVEADTFNNAVDIGILRESVSIQGQAGLANIISKQGVAAKSATTLAAAVIVKLEKPAKGTTLTSLADAVASQVDFQNQVLVGF